MAIKDQFNNMLDQIYVDDEDEEKVSPKVTILDLESD